MEEPPDNEELAERVAELERAMRELQSELTADTDGPTGGLPSPPDAGDVLRFADEAAIPALIFVLKANIRILQALRRAIRAAESRSDSESGDRVALVGERTLDRFDSIVSELQRAVEGAPDNAAASDVLEEAKALRAELDQRVRDAKQPDESEEAAETDDSIADTIDIDEELDAIRREHRGDEEATGPDHDSDGDDSADE